MIFKTLDELLVNYRPTRANTHSIGGKDRAHIQ
jgi:hypothetical protein